MDFMRPSSDRQTGRSEKGCDNLNRLRTAFHPFSIFLPPEHVAFAPASQNERRVEAFVDLGPEIANVNVHDIGRVLVVLVVEMLPDHGAADDLAAMESEELQEGVFARREVDALPAALDGAGRRVDLQVAYAQDRV